MARKREIRTRSWRGEGGLRSERRGVPNRDAEAGTDPFSILLLSHRLFNLKSNLAKKFCPFPNVD